MLAQAAQRGRYNNGILVGTLDYNVFLSTGKTITQLLKELDEQEAAAAAEQQEPDTQA